MIERQKSRPSEGRCSLSEFREILAAHAASWLQNITLPDLPSGTHGPKPPLVQARIHPLEVPLAGKVVVLWRLTERGDTHWLRRTLPIFEDGYYVHHILQDLRGVGRGLDLPHVYAVWSRRFGQSSRHLDPWKEPFRFPLLLQLKQSDQTIYYHLALVQNRSGLEFRFRRERRGVAHLDPLVYHTPFAQELSRRELNQCVGFLLEYTALLFHASPVTYAWDFQLAVPSNGLAYGCRHHAFYCQLADASKQDQTPASEHRATHETPLVTRETGANDDRLPAALTRAEE